MSDVSVRITLTISGQLASLKNSRRMVYVNGKPRLIPKKEAIEWERGALMQLPADHRLKLTGPIRLICTVYYKSRRSDLDIAAIMDYLQRGEVIVNDRQVEQIIASKKLDPVHPRVELVVEELRSSGLVLPLSE